MPNTLKKKSEFNVSLPKMADETNEETNLDEKSNTSQEVSLLTDSKVSKQDKIVEHGLLLHYKLPILDIKRPAAMKGPFNFNHVSSLRDLRSSVKNNCKRQINSVGNSNQFYDDLELEEFFKDKANWSSMPKFTNTNSFLSSTQTYLPSVKFDKEILAISDEYKRVYSKSKSK